MNPIFMCGRPLGPVWKLEDQKRKINSILGKNIEPYLWKTSSLVNILPLGNCWSAIETFILLSGRIIVCPWEMSAFCSKITIESLEVSKYKEGAYSGLNKSVTPKHTAETYHVLRHPGIGRGQTLLVDHPWEQSCIYLKKIERRAFLGDIERR